MIDEYSSYWDFGISVDEVDGIDGDSDLFENNFDLISSSYRVASAETHIVFNEQSRSNYALPRLSLEHRKREIVEVNVKTLKRVSSARRALGQASISSVADISVEDVLKKYFNHNAAWVDSLVSRIDNGLSPSRQLSNGEIFVFFFAEGFDSIYST